MIADDNVSGVYMLFRGGLLTYVGMSAHCGARIEQHKRVGREFDFSAIMPLPKRQAVWVEAALIRALQPKGNRAHTIRSGNPGTMVERTEGVETDAIAGGIRRSRAIAEFKESVACVD